MKKIYCLILLPILFLATSCEDDNNDLQSETTVSNSSDQLSLKSAGSGWTSLTSNCKQPSNTIEFLAPTSNTEHRTNLNDSNNGMVGWGLVTTLSDEFNYSAGKNAAEFQSRWKLGYINAFTGVKPTIWSDSQVNFENISTNNRALVIKADKSGDNLLCGMITTKATSCYPLYQEARVKVSKSQLANAVWMISNDAKQLEEIDNLETYGPATRSDGSSCLYPWFANKLHLSHHTFAYDSAGKRLDYQPLTATWMSRKTGDCSSNLVNWSAKYHIYGVKWESATKLVYYVDGVKVKTVTNGDQGIDPKSYTTCGGLKKEMHMIISQAAQTWRYGTIADFWASGDDLTGDITKMYVDWIKVYTPTGKENRSTCNE
ncbi:hypothetical protein BZG02_05050 [Labilibaculum filiforme]|uniref:GH16 domain-containing protein n=1 Tax=Labilibaculum filiforme TaxID=1940526 RepID=A0A2N3I1J3_9BACT|nr:family 16 glycosylhydrolase [Labilibaculum filiforme]PKQ64195.1 hypothetical protein BZG02_05050 [Labilibaculum filiforme]